MTWAS